MMTSGESRDTKGLGRVRPTDTRRSIAARVGTVIVGASVVAAGLFAAGVSSVAHASGKVATKTTLSSFHDTATLGSSVSFTAFVRSLSGGGIPTGTATFYDTRKTLLGKQTRITLATVTLDRFGFAEFATNALPLGSNYITAKYSGDAADNPSTSNVVNEQIHV